MANKPVSEYDRNPSGVAMGIAVTMAWQLAFIVILPIAGGSVLDAKLKSEPLWTLVGMAIAMAGMIVVVRQAMQELKATMRPHSTNDNKDDTQV